MEYITKGQSVKVSLSNSELWSRAVQYGEAARRWRQKFLGLLPEIARRDLWRVHGFESVFMFAFKVGGVSEKQVRRVLNLEERFRKMPQLRSPLTEGQVSANKLARIASVATVENQEELVSQVRLLSQSAVETLVRDIKTTENKAEGVRAHTFSLEDIELAPELIERLNILREKGIDINQLLTEFLDKREEEIALTKATISEEASVASSRYIPARVRQLIEKEYGTKCAIPHCSKPSNEIHHTARYSIIRNHNPNFLAPLCRQHHEIAHSIDVRVQEYKRK